MGYVIHTSEVGTLDRLVGRTVDGDDFDTLVSAGHTGAIWTEDGRGCIITIDLVLTVPIVLHTGVVPTFECTTFRTGNLGSTFPTAVYAGPTRTLHHSQRTGHFACTVFH